MTGALGIVAAGDVGDLHEVDAGRAPAPPEQRERVLCLAAGRRALAHRLGVEYDDRAPLRLQPAKSPHRLERLARRLSRTARPAAQLLLGHRHVHRHTALRRHSKALAELKYPSSEAADTVRNRALDAPAVTAAGA